MKTIKIIFFILLFTQTLSYAGEIFGTITREGQPLINQKILITTTDGKQIIADSAITDANGYFSITIVQTGQFVMTIADGDYKGAAISVSSNNSPSGYILLLSKDATGKWNLKKQ